MQQSQSHRANMDQTSTPSAYEQLLSGIETFAAEFTANVYLPRVPTKWKIIHDTLWGTIRLEPWEVAILDLPLLQRLRQISQTSLVSYVFPGARHSRFEHTLGVLHQTQRLTDAVNKQYLKGLPFDSDSVRELRLAALFHDVGHSLFSHISEHLYRHLPDLAPVLKEKYPSGNPHEVMSSLLLESKPVQAYLRSLESVYSVSLNTKRAAKWIVGHHAENGTEYLTQVINGPFDADKLDYLFRDSHFSGIPMSLDLDRLWTSTDVNFKNGPRILTLSQGSAIPLEQIVFNKMNLFATVYQHPKVRAAECMFHSTMQCLRDQQEKVAGRDLSSATDFLWLTDQTFFAEADRRKKSDPIHQMIHDILYRRHFVRALTISQDTHAGPGECYLELRKLNGSEPDDYQKRRELAKAIWLRAGKPCFEYQVCLDLPPNPPTGGADHTYVRTPSGTLRKLTELFPIGNWSEFYADYKWRGHVFCPPHCQQEVYQAAKDVFSDTFDKLKFKKVAGELSHVPNP